MASIPLDVQTEILLRLPVKSLLRFRATSKFYCHTIDSPNFRKSHFLQNTNEDDTLLLQCNSARTELSLLLPNSKEFITCMEFSHKNHELGGFALTPDTYIYRLRRVAGPVNGLICIHDNGSAKPIAICNPSLGKIKILPPSSPTLPSCNCPDIRRQLGIGFHGDYKVVQLLYCYQHRRLHASVYSKGTDSWRELVLDNFSHVPRLDVIEPIKSSCRKGSFAHWRAKNYILSFDMKNEVFRALYMPQYDGLRKLGKVKIFAKKEDDSFVLFLSRGKEPYNSLEIYEATIQGNRLLWHLSRRVKSVCGVLPSPKAVWGNQLVGSVNGELVLYDSHAPEFVKRFHLPAGILNSSIIEYKCSFVSP